MLEGTGDNAPGSLKAGGGGAVPKSQRTTLKFPEFFQAKASCKSIIRSHVTSSQMVLQLLICLSNVILFWISASSLESSKLHCASQSLRKFCKMTDSWASSMGIEVHQAEVRRYEASWEWC